jgi:hypothetical protein
MLSSSSTNFRIRPSGLSPIRINPELGSYRQSIGLLGQVISPVARPLPTQDNRNTEETRTDIHDLSRIRTHERSVWAGEDISCLRPRGHCDRQLLSTGQSSPGVGFLPALRFLPSVLIQPTSPYSWIVIWSTLYSIDTCSIVK